VQPRMASPLVVIVIAVIMSAPAWTSADTWEPW
jgi:hypothetical protein